VVVSPTLSKAGRIFQGGHKKNAASSETMGATVQQVREEMRDGDAAFLAVSEEAPSNNQDELDQLE
jgi:hypothetical protein